MEAILKEQLHNDEDDSGRCPTRESQNPIMYEASHSVKILSSLQCSEFIPQRHIQKPIIHVGTPLNNQKTLNHVLAYTMMQF